MNGIIQNKLNEIEKSEKVKILFCAESGSRAWGFASPDSDYDVRFVYVREKEYYLKLDETRDVIEWQLDDTLDINGWDLQKALRLLHKSNPTLFEWNSSPIVYRITPEWKKVSAAADKYFRRKSGLYHYLSTAKGNYREYLKTDTVRLKKYFYVLRPILACKWILDKQTPPPMPFKTLSDCYLKAPIKPLVENLLALKINSPEIGTGKRIDEINEYIETELSELQAAVLACPDEAFPTWEELNALFLDILRNR